MWKDWKWLLGMRKPERSGLTPFEEAVLERLFKVERKVTDLELREVVHEEGSLIEFNRISQLEQWRINTDNRRKAKQKLPA